MNTLLYFSFFFSSHQPQPACTTQGTPMLEIRERSEVSKAMTTKRIYASGAWTFESNNANARGCFDRNELRSIRRALQEAAWKVTSSPIACFAYDPNYTEYVLNGRLRYTHRMCSGKTADYQTLEAIDLVQREFAEDLPVPPPAPPAPPAPPVKPVHSCAVEGTSLIEIHTKSEAHEPTSIATIFASGHWRYQPIDKDGRAGAMQSGCFDQRTMRTLVNAINRAPWDVTFSRIVCRAYSPSFTEYYVNGTYEYTERLCGEQRIDSASAAAIDLIEAELAKVVPSQLVGGEYRAPAPVLQAPPVRDHRAAY